MTIDAGKLHALVDAYFAGPAWAVLHEVPNATGAGKVRTADAIAISLWPSRGLEIHGLEIKVSRSDWRRELKQPEKSVPIQRYCHRCGLSPRVRWSCSTSCPRPGGCSCPMAGRSGLR